tara:strand:+ start:46 stop:264 length:219 start_codon:yes stop_codon:yes gene_type:complete
MDNDTRQIAQLLLDRIVELEKRNALIEDMLDKAVDRLDDLDNRGLNDWPRKVVITQAELDAEQADADNGVLY